MVQEFYRLQNENYDTAVPRFIELFGDDALLYLSSKSKSVAGGLEASEQFGDWERDNENLLEQFPATAGYLAPGGDDFSFEVWDRQLRKGRRERLSDTEIIKQAQYRMGASIYRSYRTQVGAYPTAEQRAWLGNIRKEINKRYAGFPVVPVFTVGEFESTLSELRTLIELPQLENNCVATSIATYLGLSTFEFSDTFEAMGSEWKGRSMSAYIFIVAVLITVILARTFACSETKSEMFIAFIFAIVTALFFFKINMMFFDKEAINFLGLPYLSEKAASGTPIYVCSADPSANSSS
jgi:hypothetical protein